MRIERVSYPGARVAVDGYLALPDGQMPHPGVVVIHEVFGLNGNIRDIARRLAGEGYAALAADLFGDRSRALCMARIMASALAGRDPSEVGDLRASLRYLGSRPEVDPERLGAIGFCMGGGLAIAWARREPGLRAIAPFYASNPRPLEEAVRRICPVVGSYPGRDLTARHGLRLDAHLDRLGVPHDIKIYPGARHSFFNDQGRAHDPAASADAWRRTLAFFAEHVRSGQLPSPTGPSSSPTG
ncbi:MAG TPA: dienelactone hydrolase family protein [Candidatus Binatia bacterium]|nr:dienelactone hydrolase family protein [Candidatus Binatia bacterium]